MSAIIRNKALAEFPTVLDSPDYRMLILLKQHYGISKLQIKTRLKDLGLYAVNVPKSSMKSVERIQTRKLLDSKLDPLYFYENTVRFKLRVMEAENQGLISRQEASALLPKRYV